MHINESSVSRWRLATFAITTAVLAGACGSTEPATLGPVAVTQPASVEALLTVDTPQVGDLFASPALIQGETSSSTVGYRLSAGDIVLAEGTLTAVDGEYATVAEFTGACCTDMLLEVFQTHSGGLALTIPLTNPDPGETR